MKKTLGRFAILTASAAIMFGGAAGTASAVDWVFLGSYPTEGECLVAADNWASSDVRTRCQYTQSDGWYLFAYSIGG